MAFPSDDPARAHQPDAAAASGSQPAGQQAPLPADDPHTAPRASQPLADDPQAVTGSAQPWDAQIAAQGPEGWPDAHPLEQAPPGDPTAAVAGTAPATGPRAADETVGPTPAAAQPGDDAQRQRAEGSPAELVDPAGIMFSDSAGIASVDTGDRLSPDAAATDAQPEVSSAAASEPGQHDAPAFEVTPAWESDAPLPDRGVSATVAATDDVTARIRVGPTDGTNGPERPGLDDLLQRMRGEFAARSGGNPLFAEPDTTLSISGNHGAEVTAEGDAQARPVTGLEVDWQQYDSIVEAVLERTATHLAALVRQQLDEALNEREFREAAHWRAVGG